MQEGLLHSQVVFHGSSKVSRYGTLKMKKYFQKSFDHNKSRTWSIEKNFQFKFLLSSMIWGNKGCFLRHSLVFFHPNEKILFKYFQNFIILHLTFQGLNCRWWHSKLTLRLPLKKKSKLANLLTKSFQNTKMSQSSLIPVSYLVEINGFISWPYKSSV